MARSQGYGRFLTYLLVNKALEIKINEPETMPEHLIVEFDDSVPVMYNNVTDY